MQTYWHIDFECADPEEEGWKLFELGALGVEELSSSRVRVSWKGSEKGLEPFIDAALGLGFTFERSAAVEDENWVAKCAEVFEDISVDGISIRPVANRELVSSAEDRSTIHIIPGHGFGTGHHQTTQQALHLLQTVPVRELHPKSVLDFGCGSGVLSIACTKLYLSNVIAVDIDLDAIENAKENAELNHCLDSITFACPPPESLGEGFDLICANIFAEVLLENCDRLLGSLKKNGLFIAAGILKESAEVFLGSYVNRMSVLQRLETDEWHAFLLRLDK